MSSHTLVASPTRRFVSRIDRFLLFATLIPLVASTLACAFLAASFREPMGWVVAGLMLAADAFVAWIYLGTFYLVGEGQLVIRSGPFRWRIALDEVQSILPSRSILSSPALSLDRLEIRYGRRGSILVSPAERSDFLEAVKSSSSGLTRDAGGLRRVAP